MPADASSSFWLFHLPQLFLAGLMYTLIGRFLLSLFFHPNSDKVIWRAFKTVTGPFVNATRAITPLAVPDNIVVLFAFVWALFARLGLFMLFLKLGLAPTAGA